MKTIRVATYNVENLFSRAKVFGGEDSSKTSAILTDAAVLQNLIQKPAYSEADKSRMLELLKKHKALADGGPFFLQETRSRLVSNGRIIAAGRDAWTGWIEWRRELIQTPAIKNTARIITEVNADIICLVEVESRPVLQRFNDTALKSTAYPHAMLIDGNDERGIDVGTMSRFPIADMRSHVDDENTATKRPVFSRDCPEFQIELPGRRKLWLLCNHFKSRGYGSKAENDAKRRSQCERVAQILNRFDLKKDLVIVAGDFNELPDSDSLAPLLKLRGLHNAFDKLPRGEAKWTHRDDAVPSKNNQIDYILVSQALWPALKKVGIERRGIWASAAKTRSLFPPLKSVTGDTNAASDHAAVWADFTFD